MLPCPFCEALASGRAGPANDHAAAIPDRHPVTPGHSLIVSRRHVSSYFDLSPDEQRALWQLVPRVRSDLQNSHQPAGFNLGLNDGTAAGQTIPHVHLHVIPRYDRDVPDPRGGVRWVIPERAAYWNDDAPEA